MNRWPGDGDTKIGGPRTSFPSTRKSAVDAAASPNAQRRAWAVEVIVGAYWKPVYKYIRMKWGASKLRRILLTHLKQMTGSEREFHQESRVLLGVNSR